MKPVYLLLVGESTIQDFNFSIEKKESVKIFQELGYFNWGSQTIILYNPRDYEIGNIKNNSHYFVGDSLE